MASTATKRRRGPKHPGVVLLKAEPERRIWWRARFTDPDTRKTHKETLPTELTTAEQREKWAVDKSRDLARRKLALQAGASRLRGVPIGDAVDDYHKRAENRLRGSTVALYKMATGLFTDWAEGAGIRTTMQLTATKLPYFRDYLVDQKKKAYVTGGRRGERAAGSGKLKPNTANWQLRAVKTVLNDLRVRGLVPLTSDAITDALKPVPLPKDPPEFLSTRECRQLIEAVLAHDAKTFDATRDEHAGNKKPGSTKRYDPIAPFVATVLLTGMRIGEALSLRWAAVNLDATDGDGRRVGEIRLASDETKTHEARSITLRVSPSVFFLLHALRARAGNDVYVFGGSKPLARTMIEAARRRLVGEVPKKERTKDPLRKRKEREPIDFGAPRTLTWQLLRSTCATYQCNAPSLFGDAAAFVSAKRLGHSVEISEKHYAGQLSVSRNALTLESAMNVADLMVKVALAALEVA